MVLRFFTTMPIMLAILCFKSSESYTLHTATACISKRHLGQGFNLTDSTDAPLTEDGVACGEDDFLISRVDEIYLLNVADGVGSWSLYGVNPKIFTNELLNSVDEIFRSLSSRMWMNHDRDYNAFLKRLVSTAFDDVLETKPFIQFGSSTLVSLSINIENLRANSYVLGDSGFMIVRNQEIYYRSRDMVHGFNFPFQLSFDEEATDDPLIADTHYFQLAPNDVIIIGSDGLFDNLFDGAILAIVNNETQFLSLSSQKGYTEAARRIAKILTIEAKKIGETVLGEVATPFSEALNELDYVPFTVFIGKNDDTTVICAIIS